MLLPKFCLSLPGAALLLSVAAVGLAPSSSVAGETVASCAGLPATIVGTEGRDHLEGTGGPDVIAALGGPDYVDALDGDDIVCGGLGRDNLIARGGNDTVLGGGGADFLNGGAGSDTARGYLGADSVYGGGGSDDVHGGAGVDRLNGGGGPDTIRGGDGRDLVDYAGHLKPVTVDLRASGSVDGSAEDGPKGSRDTVGSVENIRGGYSWDGDKLFGNGRSNYIDGSLGADRLFGLGGRDQLVGFDDYLDQGGSVDADELDCGPGSDAAYVDSYDSQPVDCEEIEQGFSPSPS